MSIAEIQITVLQLASVPLLVLLNGFFVAAEFALVKIRDTQLETLVAEGHRRAKVARRIVQNLDLAQRTRFSRFPLCEGGNIDKTLGVVNSKDMVALQHQAKSGWDLAAAARKIIFVPDTARLENLLTLFLQRKLHFALVVDEYASTVGLVTLENVLEELVGPIEDEFDQEEPLFQPGGDGVWKLNGSLPVHKLSELVGEPIEMDKVSTVSGLMTQQLGRFPRGDDVLSVGAWNLRVEEMIGTRVMRLNLTRRAETDAPMLGKPGLHAVWRSPGMFIATDPEQKAVQSAAMDQGQASR